MSKQTDLADGVVAELNRVSDAGEFSIALRAERVPMVDLTLEGLQDLAVSVVPAPRKAVMETQVGDLVEAKIDVAIQKKLGAGKITNADVDPLLELQEEVEAAFFADGKRMELQTPAGRWWICMGFETLAGAEAGYAPEHLKQKRCFTGITRFLWRRVG